MEKKYHMSFKFTGEIRKEDSNFILHANTQLQVCSCGTWQTGPSPQAHGLWRPCLLMLPRQSCTLWWIFVTCSWKMESCRGKRTDWTASWQESSGLSSGTKPSEEDLQTSGQLNTSHSNYSASSSTHDLKETYSLHWEALNSNPPQATGPTPTLTGQGFYHWSSGIQHLIEFCGINSSKLEYNY